MKYLKIGGLIVLSLYGLYLFKSALGINLSTKYTAWEFIKYPIKPITERHHS
jgi:hypothetical protein